MNVPVFNIGGQNYNVKDMEARNQVADLKADLNKDGSLFYPTLSSDDLEDNALILADGTVYQNNNYVATKHISIKDVSYGNCIQVFSTITGSACLAFYNEDKTCISHIGYAELEAMGYTSGTAKWLIPVPLGAKYFRTSVAKSLVTGNVTPETFMIAYLRIMNISKLIDIVEAGITTDDFESVLKNSFSEEYTDYDLDFSNTDHYARYDNGEIVAYSGEDCTGYVNCENVIKMRISGKNYLSCTVIAFYDSSKNFIGAYPNTTTETTYENEIIHVPTFAKYFIANNHLGSTRVGYLSNYTMGATSEKWAGLTWVCFGDSLTAINTPTNKRYFDYISEKTGISIVNMGSSGTGYANDGGDNRAFYQRISNCPDCDIITVFGSFNDMASGKELGTATDTGTTTIAGCMNTTFDNLFAIHPTIQLGVISPTPLETYNPLSEPNGASAYCDMLKAICSRRGIPYLDLFRVSGLRPWEASYRALVYSKDNGMGIHPNELGHEIIAPHIQSFVETLLIH